MAENAIAALICPLVSHKQNGASLAIANESQVNSDIERISVYEQQNRVVMNSGLATKSEEIAIAKTEQR